MKKICINNIRNLPSIVAIINSCAGFGRTWGTKGSPLHGSHICFINTEEVVLLIQDKETGKLSFITFKQVDKTNLGESIKAALQKEEISFEEKKVVP